MGIGEAPEGLRGKAGGGEEVSPRELRERRARRHPPAPFIVGVNRSGTTLLRMMLDAHPELAIPPETHFVHKLIETMRKLGPVEPERAVGLITEHRRWGDFGLDPEELVERLRSERPEEVKARHALRSFYGLYAEGQGKPRWGDKTPNYIKQMYAIQKVLAEARFIHVIRDGHDVALSIEGRNPGSSMTRLGERWVRRIEWARRQRTEVGHYLEVRYEDLVLEPEPTLREVCEHIELDFDPAMLDYHERAADRLTELDRDLDDSTPRPAREASERLAGHARTTEPPDASRVGRWKREMSDTDCAEFEAAAGRMLAELGYETRTRDGAKR